MRVATLALTLGAVLAATGCSRFGSDSGLNPFGWMGGGSQQPTTLEPKGGWKTEQQDGRQLVPQILSAGFQPLTEGKLLVVRAFAPVKGWWGVELVSARVHRPARCAPMTTASCGCGWSATRPCPAARMRRWRPIRRSMC